MKVGAKYDFQNELMKDVQIQDHLNAKIKNHDVIFKGIAHDIVYKMKNPNKPLPSDPLRNYVRHYMDKQLFEEPKEIDPYDY